MDYFIIIACIILLLCYAIGMFEKPDKIVRTIANEKFFVIPPSLCDKLADIPIVSPVYITDKGYYPNALGHYCERPTGCDEYILHVCVDGKGWFELANKQMEVKPGQFFILPADLPHRYGSDITSPWTIFWTHFKGTSSQYYYQQLPADNPIAYIDSSIIQMVTQLYEHCFTCLDAGFSIANLIHASTTFNQILSCLFFHKSSYVQGISTPQLKVIESSINYMRSNITQQLDLHDFAGQANMSVPHYSRVFKAKTDTSPIDYFIRLKIQLACQHLASGDKSIKQTAHALGYNDQFYFSRIFKKIMSISPLQYQQNFQ